MSNNIFDPRFGSVFSKNSEMILVWLSTPRGSMIVVMANGRSETFFDLESETARKVFILQNILTNVHMREMLRDVLRLSDEQIPLLDELKEQITALKEPEQEEEPGQKDEDTKNVV